MRVAVLTSFTSDYTLGHLCEPINRQYAQRHGYSFVSEIFAPSQSAIANSETIASSADGLGSGSGSNSRHPSYSPDSGSSRRHPTWNKVRMVHDLLHSLLIGPPSADDCNEPLPIPRDTTHLLWVDADAVVVRQDVRVEELWSELPSSIELLIGEDVTPCCLINAGVFCVKVSEWSLRLWRDVWSSKGSLKFHNCRYHEQSALLRQLARRGEGLDQIDPPFHSYCGGRATPKLFPHVAVLPRRSLNTNRYDLRAEGAGEGARAPGESAVRDEDACDFIFHAAGNPILRCIGVAGTAILSKPDKPTAIQIVLAHAGLGPPLLRPPAEMATAPPVRGGSSAAASGGVAVSCSAASSSGCEMGLVRSSRTERAAMAELQARLGEAWARAREIGGGGVQC